MADQAWDPEQHAQDADQAALEYARRYQRQGIGEASQIPTRIVPAPQSRSQGSTARTFILVAGAVAVVWLWLKYRRQ
mgnify:CR=1 FL=1